mmetsp:Transcript_45249/g.130651  ORF Transcript_45249/g.130651 Transcript_45249/m.130651 type:complete len:317 (+) Transcript_45249:1160-2110(+)
MSPSTNPRKASPKRESLRNELLFATMGTSKSHWSRQGPSAESVLYCMLQRRGFTKGSSTMPSSMAVTWLGQSNSNVKNSFLTLPSMLSHRLPVSCPMGCKFVAGCASLCDDQPTTEKRALVSHITSRPRGASWSSTIDRRPEAEPATDLGPCSRSRAMRRSRLSKRKDGAPAAASCRAPSPSMSGALESSGMAPLVEARRHEAGRPTCLAASTRSWPSAGATTLRRGAPPDVTSSAWPSGRPTKLLLVDALSRSSRQGGLICAAPPWHSQGAASSRGTPTLSARGSSDTGSAWRRNFKERRPGLSPSGLAKGGTTP